MAHVRTGRPPGRPAGSPGMLQKTWLRNLMVERLQTREDATEYLDSLIKADLAKYLEVLIKLFPKEADIDIHVNRFASWTDEQLKGFIKTGEYPENEAEAKG